MGAHDRVVDRTLTFPDTARRQQRASSPFKSAYSIRRGGGWRGRFAMKRSLATAILLSASMLLSGQLALAGEKWCEEDPVLTIDGRTVDYTASFPSANLIGTTVNWTFHIPSNVLIATAITPPAVGSPTIPSTVTIIRDQPAYLLLSDAIVSANVLYAASSSFSTSTAVQGLNSSWSAYSGRSNKKQTISTSYSTLPLLY